jgi:hypothetical protein
MKVCVGMEVHRHLLFTTAKWDGEWSVSRRILCFRKNIFWRMVVLTKPELHLRPQVVDL